MRDAALVRPQQRHTDQHHGPGRATDQRAALRRLGPNDDLVERLQLTLQRHVVQRDHGTGLNAGPLRKTRAHRAAGAQLRVGNHAPGDLDIAARFQQPPVDHALDQNVAAGLNFHTLAHFAFDQHRAFKMDIAARHIDFGHPQDRIHMDTPGPRHRLSGNRCLQQIAVLAGHLRTHQRRRERLVAPRMGRQHAAANGLSVHASGRRDASHQGRTGLHRGHGAMLAVIDKTVLIELGGAVDRVRNQRLKNRVASILGQKPEGDRNRATAAGFADLVQGRVVDSEHHADRGKRLLDFFEAHRPAALGRCQAERCGHLVGRNLELHRGVTALRQ